MKLSNFTYLDPAEGGKGLSGASNADREIWEEFYGRFEPLADASEPILTPELATPTGSTEIKSLVTQRRHQSFFRKAVLGSYGNRCCISGLPIPSLLRASHIIPWRDSVEHRLNPANGLCLAGTYDLAFDQHFISVDDHFRLQIGGSISQLSKDLEVQKIFLGLRGQKLLLPEKNHPSESFLASHRKRLR